MKKTQAEITAARRAGGKAATISPNLAALAAQPAAGQLVIKNEDGSRQIDHPLGKLELLAPEVRADLARKFAGLDFAKFSQWPKEAKAAVREISMPARAVVNATVQTALAYVKLAEQIRISPLSPKHITEILKQQGFADSRISELKNVAMAKDEIWSKYSAAHIGFKAALNLARLDKQTQKQLPEPPAPPAPAPSTSGGTPSTSGSTPSTSSGTPSTSSGTPSTAPANPKLEALAKAEEMFLALSRFMQASPMLADALPISMTGTFNGTQTKFVLAITLAETPKA